MYGETHAQNQFLLDNFFENISSLSSSNPSPQPNNPSSSIVDYKLPNDAPPTLTLEADASSTGDFFEAYFGILRSNNQLKQNQQQPTHKASKVIAFYGNVEKLSRQEYSFIFDRLNSVLPKLKELEHRNLLKIFIGRECVISAEHGIANPGPKIEIVMERPEVFSSLFFINDPTTPSSSTMNK